MKEWIGEGFWYLWLSSVAAIAGMLMEGSGLCVDFEEEVVLEGVCVFVLAEGRRRRDRLVEHWISEMVGGYSWHAAAGSGLADLG